ncbi:MAG: hypothetical protein IJH11_05050 [Lachnospiraceae bacterium]|nr:hypothetical protein [Lachnospiraceae bacterium]
MKKLTILATVLAVAAGLTAGVAGYIVLNNKPDNSNVATVAQKESASETTSADTAEATASGDTAGAGNAAASGETAAASNATAASENTAAGNAAANEAASADNTAASNGTANEPADNAAAPNNNAAVNEPATGPNAGEETVGAPDAASAAQTTSTGLDLNTAQAIRDASVANAPSAQGDVGRGYYIYDIDKDGVPELLLTHEEGTNRGLAVFTYVDGAVAECGVMWGFAHGLPFPASYPEGNGIVLEECARGYQCIWLISKNGTAMSDTINSDSANLFTEELRTAWPTYYTDIEDDFGYYYNHQYRTVLSPYFEGSEALSLCDPADDTAIREALGMS